MRSKLIGLLLAVALVTMTITIVNNNTKQTEQKLNRQIETLEHKTREQQKLEVENLKKEIETIKQSKAAEKARIASENAQKAAQASLAQKVANVAVPTANAATGDNYALVTKWANHYGIDPAWLHRVVKCESGYRSNAVNGSYWAQGSTPTGIGQFLATTYIANAARIGLPAVDERLNPDRSLQVMAWMFSIGQSRQWECK
jgi:soluble lytic murein transglycosylase-like protein